MTATTNYLFTSARLGFRPWRNADFAPLVAMNADPEVMEFFEDTMTEKQSLAFVDRMKEEYARSGYCYFPVEELATSDFVGIIGLSLKTFKSAWTPNVDIGWRLVKKHWYKGYATEGAARCITYGLHTLKLPKIISLAPAINTRSIAVMQKIGMVKAGEFIHPQIAHVPLLKNCVMYETAHPQ